MNKPDRIGKKDKYANNTALLPTETRFLQSNSPCAATFSLVCVSIPSLSVRTRVRAQSRNGRFVTQRSQQLGRATTETFHPELASAIRIVECAPNKKSVGLASILAECETSSQGGMISSLVNHYHTYQSQLVTSAMFEQDQTENEFRNIKLKLKGPNRHSELQAVKALMAMSAQHNLCETSDKEPMDLSGMDSPEPVYGLSITMTEEEFRVLAEKEGIKDVIGDPICKLCGGLFSGPLGIALHMCPAMKRQTYRCEICGEDKWKTKANLHSHIKWCKKRLDVKTDQHEKQIY